MKTRRLGDGGPVVSAIGLGCMNLARAGAEEAASTVRTALDRGVTLFDTADYYGQGAAEELLGRLLGPARDSVVLATKTGIVHRDGAPPRIDGTPAHIIRCCDESLKRLRTDRIDLYYLARVDRAVPIEESIGAMAELVGAGKVGHIGICEAAPRTIRRAHAVHPVAAVQTEYSLLERHVEDGVLAACDEAGIGFVAYRPLGSGLLTGTPIDLAALPPTDWRRRDPRFKGGDVEHNRRLAMALVRSAESRGVTPAELALAWLLSRGDGIVPIPGTCGSEHVRGNAAAASLDLTAAESALLSELFPPGCAAGDRYPPQLMATIDRG